MKTSNYIYIVPYNDEKSILFNGRTKKFLLLDNVSLESVVIILRNPSEFQNSHPSILDLLSTNGFIIDDAEDEISQLINERKAFVNSKEYKSTILSTFDCNYKCWYCIQKHVPSDVSKDKMDLIINHIKNYLAENEIDSYVLSWFGGEPLLEPGVIEYISSILLEHCLSRNIEFSGAITTNGSLLTSENIELLLRNRINYYQITLDGDKRTHDKIKYREGEISSFDTILHNVANLLRLNDNAQITLRFNYTIASLKRANIVDEIDMVIPEHYRQRISVDLHKVWQIDECSIPVRDLGILVKKFHDSGYQINTDHIFSICYVDKIHHHTIYYTGGVDKCDNNGIDELRGCLDSTGHIIWRDRPVIHDFDPLDEGSCCRHCKYYPLCYGCCPIRREEKIKANGKITCNYAGHFELFEHRILEYCIRHMAKKGIPL